MNQDINEKIEEHLGDLKLIDVMYRSEEEDAAVLVLCVAGFLDGSREMQTALMDKMEGYLKHINSDVFKKDYPEPNVFLDISFAEKPDRLIIQLLATTYDWCESWGAKQRVIIGKRYVKITKEDDLIEYLVGIAENMGSSVELISTETDEGMQLYRGFGGIAGILRYHVG